VVKGAGRRSVYVPKGLSPGEQETLVKALAERGEGIAPEQGSMDWQ